ncbi:ABC transporter ATP-binding protein [Planctomonas psychrotolerans]|uniref:ABC transporter ATP-binding protein n=1 Tax=Planctomonas psychrotolerans TaxID=2528712 RepID=UPI00123A5457|nr:ATP-binding cassette domain-containing protein [Planctomonas psychrotolerans]
MPAPAASAHADEPKAAAGTLAIETRGLTKSFGHATVVRDLSLAVPRGSVFGFLGPNGSGKTTTIRMLLGLASPSGGDIRMLDAPMPDAGRSVLPRVGALVEGPAFYPFLSGRANLLRFDSGDRHADPATRSRRVDAALDRVGLTAAAGKKAHAYSLGMKQRLGIANALLTPRDLLILDEPSNGLDPQGTREVRGLIRSFADEGTTVFVSSHLLAEVEQMCTHIAVMSAGNLVTQGTLDELRASGSMRVRVHTPDPGEARAVLSRLGLSPDADERPDAAVAVARPAAASATAVAYPGAASAAVASASHRDTVVTADLPATAPPPEDISRALVTAGVRVRGFSVDGASLEERFVALTGEGFDVAQ